MPGAIRAPKPYFSKLILSCKTSAKEKQARIFCPKTSFFSFVLYFEIITELIEKKKKSCSSKTLLKNNLKKFFSGLIEAWEKIKNLLFLQFNQACCKNAQLPVILEKVVVGEKKRH